MVRYQYRRSVQPPSTPTVAETATNFGAQNPSTANPAGMPGANGQAPYPVPYPATPSLAVPRALPVQSQPSPAHVPSPRLVAPEQQVPSQTGWVCAAPVAAPAVVGIGVVPYSGHGSPGMGLGAGDAPVEAASFLPFDAAAQGRQAPAVTALLVPPAEGGAMGTGTGGGTTDPRSTTAQGDPTVSYPHHPAPPSVPAAAPAPSTPQSAGYWAGVPGVAEGANLDPLPPAAQQANAGLLPEQQQPRVPQQRSDSAGPQLAGWATASPQVYDAAPPGATPADTGANVTSVDTEQAKPVIDEAKTAAWAGGAPVAWGGAAAGAAQASAAKDCGVKQPSELATERGLSAEEREFEEALAASNQAELERQQEEMEAAAAMNVGGFL